jgi:hypothetical protein
MGKKRPLPLVADRTRRAGNTKTENRSGLFLPGAFLVAVGAQLLAPFMFVDLALAAFF